MWLTEQLHAELDDIVHRVNNMVHECKLKCTSQDTLTCGLLTTDLKSARMNIDRTKAEFTALKVRLENILCETDEKE